MSALPDQQIRMTTPASITVQRATPEQAAQAVDELARLLMDCVQGGASVSFMWPLPLHKAQAFWHAVADGVARQERVLLLARDRVGAVVGTVQLVLDMPDNQPHRADVAKMLVHRSARRQGVAAQLLAAVEAVARTEGRRVLVLDTVQGGDAERLYARQGWQVVGSVPNFALMPDGVLCATTYFHKQL